MGHGSALARLQRQARLGPIESLNLALLVDGDDHGVSWRVHVETDDVLDLLGEFRIVGALEGAKPMRLQAIGAQRDADRLGHGAAGPMRGFARRLGTGQRQHFRHHAGRKRRSAWLACLVTQEAVYPFLAVAPLPAPNGRAADSGSASDFGDRQTLRRKENDARPERTITVDGNGEQALAIFGCNDNIDSLGHAARIAHPAKYVNPLSASPTYPHLPTGGRYSRGGCRSGASPKS